MLQHSQRAQALLASLPELTQLRNLEIIEPEGCQLLGSDVAAISSGLVQLTKLTIAQPGRPWLFDEQLAVLGSHPKLQQLE